MTLQAYGQRYLDRLTICSAKDVRGRWRLHIEGSDLAKLPIREVKRRHVKDFMAVLATKKKLVAKAGAKACEKVEGTETISPRSQKAVLALLSRVFSEARSDDLVETNPCEGVRVARVEDSAEETWSFLSLDEIDRLLTHPEIPAVKRLIYATAIYTALREGELWALRWRDLDLDGPNPICACRRSYQKGTKANKVRRFPLLPAAVETLRRVRERSSDASPDALVFPRPDGKMYAKGYDAAWGRWSKRAGIREEVRFHDLRHTCASHLAMGSWGRAWTLSEVRDFIGHASVSMTERYSHLGPGHLHAIASATNEKIVRALSKEEPPASAASVAAGRKAEEDAAELGNSCSIQLSYAVKLGEGKGGVSQMTPLAIASLGRDIAATSTNRADTSLISPWHMWWSLNGQHHAAACWPLCWPTQLSPVPDRLLRPRRLLRAPSPDQPWALASPWSRCSSPRSASGGRTAR